jgi:hypothetical protein
MELVAIVLGLGAIVALGVTAIVAIVKGKDEEAKEAIKTLGKILGK